MKDGASARSSAPLEAARERLARLLSTSVGDATELLWIETRRGQASSLRREEPPPILTRRTVTARVSEGPRLGRFTTEDGADGELAEGLRIALAHARAETPRATPWEPPAAEATALPAADLFDPEIAALEPKAAKALLERGLAKGEAARLRWATTRAVVVNSRGLSQAVELTGCALSIESGRGPGAGLTQRAARSFARLAPAELAERARALRTDDEELAELPDSSVALVLGPSAVAALVAHLGSMGLDAEAFARGRVLAAADLGRQLFSSAFSLADDGSSPAGLPFPFDFEGKARRRVEMVAGGVLKSPAVSEALAAALGLPVTPHYLGPEEVRAQHLFVEPGSASGDELLAAAADGLWVTDLSGLGPIEPFGPGFRATCLGARRIVDGRLERPLASFLWQDDLRRAFARVLGVGGDSTPVALDSELRGAVSAPSLAVAAGGELRLRPAL